MIKEKIFKELEGLLIKSSNVKRPAPIKIVDGIIDGKKAMVVVPERCDLEFVNSRDEWRALWDDYLNNNPNEYEKNIFEGR